MKVISTLTVNTHYRRKTSRKTLLQQLTKQFRQVSNHFGEVNLGVITFFPITILLLWLFMKLGD